ncbi:MAG: hypothetical protein JWM86_565 [Thermoleophilia bacterium]|nr:hypothetical protein [Thermoleophilia bacterium]
MLQVTHYADPACPFDFSAEPQRQQLRWFYGDQLEWRTVLVGLAENPEAYAAKGLDTAFIAKAQDQLQRQHGMPIDPTERPRLAGTVRACRAVVATRLNAPELHEAVLRRLRVRTMAGQLLDADETIDGAASDVGLDPAELASWMASDATAAALAEDMRAARTPHPVALVLDHKLSASEDGGRRYSCPSYEFSADGATRVAPGFQPWEAYDVELANLGATAGLTRRPAPTGVEEILEWADEPLATAEVAALLGTDLASARTKLLAAHAAFEPVGADGYWTAAA